MQTLDLNLAARPFKNNLLVWSGYVIGFAALAAFTLWTGNTYREHVGLLHELRNDVGQIESQMRDLETRGVRAVNGIDRFDVDSLEIKAAKANEVIDWKAFSWTRLFNRMAEMQPWNVRMTSIRPIFRGGSEAGARFAMTDGMTRESVPVAIDAIARSYDDMLEMQRALFEHPNFGRVAMERFNTGQSNEIVFQLRFLYYPEAEEDERLAEPEATGEEDGNDVVAEAVEAKDLAPQGRDGAVPADLAQDGGTQP